MSASPEHPARTDDSTHLDQGADTTDLDQAVARVEHELGRLFARIRVSWREAATTVHPDLQPLGYQVLTSIASGKATSAGAIIERLQTDKSAVSRHVRQLEQLGLVESVPDEVDRRARVLVATPLAQERVALARSRYEARLAERLRRWSADDLDHFSELLAAFGDWPTGGDGLTGGDRAQREVGGSLSTPWRLGASGSAAVSGDTCECPVGASEVG